MRYLRVYFMLIRLNALTLLIYPANFYNSLLASIAWGFFSLYSIVLLTAQTTGAFGWKREEILLLNGVYGVFIAVFHTLFSRNFERFSSVIHHGQLDSILIKPMDTQFMLSFWLFGWTSAIRILMPLFYVFYLLTSFSISLSFWQAIAFLTTGILGIILLYSVWYIVITFTIWFTRLSNLVELMFNIAGIARYPREMFYHAMGFASWFILPLVLVMNVPTHFLLKQIRLSETVILASLSLVFFWLSRKFWYFALKHYTSASS